MAEKTTLMSLTADIVAAHVSNNSVAIGDLPALIASTFQALAKLDQPVEAPAPEKPKGAVSARASIKPEHLISMIDGKPYKMLRKHIALHGFTPETYRDTFGLPRDYPMVSANYAEARRALAVKIGLGRKPGKAAAATQPARAPTAAKPTRPPRTDK
ncbi:MucR family transcriptional regulator [Sphingomonas sp.]|uniref:MucR family transcriptional regulator n=1 Tax=Sphingomonas sp. TaxID=28214 RepID=UPI001B22F88F|nr:MucR family transcriptional regulator [Sphingomonas sp.]MBO9712626.1 MucR family transcriptional regulator [Sphingomonas sp.]